MEIQSQFHVVLLNDDPGSLFDGFCTDTTLRTNTKNSQRAEQSLVDNLSTKSQGKSTLQKSISKLISRLKNVLNLTNSMKLISDFPRYISLLTMIAALFGKMETEILTLNETNAVLPKNIR